MKLSSKKKITYDLTDLTATELINIKCALWFCSSYNWNGTFPGNSSRQELKDLHDVLDNLYKNEEADT